MSSLHDFALAIYHRAAMNIRPHVYLVLMLAVILIAAMKYDGRKRAKRAAENQQGAPAE